MRSVTFLSGGTGTPKLLDGIDGSELRRDEVSVVVNTGDDVVVSGNLVCPDVDTVLYTLSGRIDRGRWWGIEDDTYTTHEAIVGEGPRVKEVEATRPLGEGRSFSGDGEFMLIGDRDRATHILRTSMLDGGATLTEATRGLAERMGVEADVLPMSDDRVATYLRTPDGWTHFQVWWVAHDGGPEVDELEFRGADGAEATNEALDALRNPVVIGPSNPVTSLGPMLALDGVQEALAGTTVVAVSPFVGGEVVSGPAAGLMRATGLEPSSRGVYEAYEGFVDSLVVEGATDEVEGDVGCRVVEAETRMRGEEDAARLLDLLVGLARD